MMRRDLVLAGAGAVCVLGAVLAYDRVFSGPSWRVSTLLAILVPTLLAVIIRALRMPAAVTAILSLLGLFVAAYVIFGAPGPLVPGPEQLRQLIDLAWDGAAQVTEHRAPIEPFPGLVLILFAGTWVIAHVTHEVIVRANVGAIGLATPAALWIVPVAIPVETPRVSAHTVPFLLGAVLYLLATAEQDVTGWATDRSGPRLSAMGGALGLTAIVLSLAMPLAAFGYGSEAWVDLQGSSDPRGYQPIVDVGDRLKLPEPRDVLRVRANRPSYLRIAALETFDGTTWRIGPASQASFRPADEDLFDVNEPLPPEVPILGNTVDVAADVEVLELENIYVPVPYQPQRITGPDTRSMVYSRIGGFVATAELTDQGEADNLRVGVTPGVRYVVDATTPDPTYEELLAAEWTPEDLVGRVELPNSYSRIRALTAQIMQDAGAESTIDRVLAVQDWFIGQENFLYSTDVPDLRGEDALDRFLFETRVGYCEYFATAMAVMLRTLNIPARVSVGFLPGTLTDEFPDGTHEWTVSSRDAHAWVEVLFPGSGWVKFDPTPRADGATFVPTRDDITPERSQAELGQEPGSVPTGTPSEEPTEQPSSEAATGAAGAPTEAPTEEEVLPAGGGWPLWALVLLGLGLALLAIMAWSLLADRRPAAHDPIGRVRVAQGRLHDEAARLGVGRHVAETSHELAARLAAEGRVDAEASLRLADLSAAAVFGERAEVTDAVEAEQLSNVAVRQLRASAGRRDRLVSPLRRPFERVHGVVEAAAARAWTLLDRVRDR